MSCIVAHNLSSLRCHAELTDETDRIVIRSSLHLLPFENSNTCIIRAGDIHVPCLSIPLRQNCCANFRNPGSEK
jgi:hypothetical protein